MSRHINKQKSLVRVGSSHEALGKMNFTSHTYCTGLATCYCTGLATCYCTGLATCYCTGLATCYCTINDI
ncbi:MAG: hypothetical protein H7061_09670 [Bdellovibrionaceae bacterium]|nr:hypothetical protein [Bdellovibrio sp.]